MSRHIQILKQRLEFDLRVVLEQFCSSSLIQVEAYANRADFEQRLNPMTTTSGPRPALHYRVHYQIRSLIGPGRYHSGFDIHFDLESQGTYPESSADSGISVGGILAACVSKPIPWNPHFLEGIGTVCLGSIWQGAEHTLLAHVILHVARLLNWEEKSHSAYEGWNPEAVRYWRKQLGAMPLQRLSYPALPLHLTHGRSAAQAPDAFSARGQPITAPSLGIEILETMPERSEHSNKIIII